MSVRFEKVAMIARWKPVHVGHATVLDGIARSVGSFVVGIGSSNKYDAKNPFTAKETRDMLELVIGDRSNVSIVEVPDLDDPPRWRVMVKDMLGPLDAFVTANAAVRDLMRDFYRVVHPVGFVAPEDVVAMTGTRARDAMLAGGDWRSMVPAAVAKYLEERGLVARFRAEHAR